MAHPRPILVVLVSILTALLVGLLPSNAQSINLPIMVLEITNTNNSVFRTRNTSVQESKRQVLTVGTVLEKGDYLEIPTGNKVVIMCDGKYIEFTVPSAITCTNTIYSHSSIFLWGQIKIVGDFRSGNAPRIMTPRNTRLANLPTSIQWEYNKIDPSVNLNYSVEIYDGINSLWKAPDLKNMSVDFPRDKVQLTASSSYQVKVSAIPENQMTEESSDSAIFCIVDSHVTEAINYTLSAPNSSYPANTLSQNATDYLRSYLFYQEGLYHDALTLLLRGLTEPLDKPLPNNFSSATELSHAPSYYILLGDIYQAMILKDRAIKAYQRAEDLAKQLGDQLSLAAVKIRIADSQKGFSASDKVSSEVKKHYEDAKEIYRELGYMDKVDQVSIIAQQQYDPRDYPPVCSF